MTENKGNMYPDIVPWNVGKGCLWNCGYCIPSFQRQAKRQKPTIDKNGNPRGCQDCYDYKPHFHPERLKKLPTVKEGQWIWAVSSGDIYFQKEENVLRIFEVIKRYPNKTFFFQTKSPDCYYRYEFPENVVLGITLETDVYPTKITDAMPLWHRYVFFKDYQHPRKIVTIEPILSFNFNRFLGWLKEINPERIYIGYNSKPKSIQLIEPSLAKTEDFINALRTFTIVKTKYMRD